MFRKARAVVSNLNTKLPILLFRLDFEQTRRGTGSNSVADGIFNYWLEDKVRYFRVEGLVAQVHAGDQDGGLFLLLRFHEGVS